MHGAHAHMHRFRNDHQRHIRPALARACACMTTRSMIRARAPSARRKYVHAGPSRWARAEARTLDARTRYQRHVVARMRLLPQPAPAPPAHMVRKWRCVCEVLSDMVHCMLHALLIILLPQCMQAHARRTWTRTYRRYHASSMLRARIQACVLHTHASLRACLLPCADIIAHGRLHHAYMHPCIHA